jgi:hypothetical protein
METQRAMAKQSQSGGTTSRIPATGDSATELRDFYPDVYASHEAYQLLDVLFPKQASWLLPLD